MYAIPKRRNIGWSRIGIKIDFMARASKLMNMRCKNSDYWDQLEMAMEG